MRFSSAATAWSASSSISGASAITTLYQQETSDEGTFSAHATSTFCRDTTELTDIPACVGIDEIGGQWTWVYDALGNLVMATTPTDESTTMQWSAGLLQSIHAPGERLTSFQYNARKDVSLVQFVF